MKDFRPTLKTAKDQVEILKRIGEARRAYFFKHERSPNTLYIGQEDFYDMLLEIEPWELGHEERPSYRGMAIFRVDTAHHLNVALIEGNADG